MISICNFGTYRICTEGEPPENVLRPFPSFKLYTGCEIMINETMDAAGLEIVLALAQVVFLFTLPMDE